MREVTLCLLTKEDEVLLAMKKRDFGKGWWNGPGGKPKKEDKTLEDTAIRETREEICVAPESLEKVAIIDFLFEGGNPEDDLDQQIHCYLVTKWTGEPKESDEMKPQWFEKEHLPLDEMWPADRYWIPLVLEGNKIRGSVRFSSDKKLIDYNFKDVTQL